ncbi:hypothetical protein C8R43DRAFT_899587, partial [Mycena crocata]
PGNHTIPVIMIARCPRVTFIVQAHWGRWAIGRDVPNFAFWAGTAMHQLQLQGIAFMHSHHISHGVRKTAAQLRNISNAAPELKYPPGQHRLQLPQHSLLLAFIDFEASNYFPQAIRSVRINSQRASGPPAAFRAQELRRGPDFNPFAADIFSLGRVFSVSKPVADVRTYHRHVYTHIYYACHHHANSCTLPKLIDDMTSPLPTASPTAAEAFD